MWVRGLKPYINYTKLQSLLSHPMWVRGLKLYALTLIASYFGRILCGCVD